jgi:drug/metabolite transporter (DMT)-like permease
LEEKIRNKKEYYIAIIFILLSVIFWGISFISTKVVLREMPPASIAFFRQLIAILTLVPVLFYRKAFIRVTFKNMLTLIISAFFGIVLYFIFENNGLKFTTASNASMIVASVPVFTLLTEAVFFKLKVTFRMIWCIILSISGVYLVITVNGKLDFSSHMFLGNMLVVGAMVVWVIYTILNKSKSRELSGILITTYQAAAAVFLFIPFVISEVPSWRMITLISLVNLIYLGIFCSAFAYFFYIYAAERLGATVSAAFLNLIPVVSVIAGYFILHESLSLLQLGGMLLIMFSLYVISKK